MTDNIKDIELIEAYLNEQLSRREKKAVEERLQNDSDFAELADDIRTLFQTIKQNYRQKIKQELQAFEKSLPPVTITANEEMHSEPRLDKKQPLFIRYVVSLKESIPTYLTSNLKKNALIISLPILVCLVIGIWWFFPRQTPEEQLFATYFEPTKMEQTRARKDKTKGELQFEATRAYNNDEFGKAIPMLRELFEKHQDTTSLYFIGLAQLGSGLPDEAIQTLTFYNSIYEDVRYTRINYYIGLAHLWERRYDLAISFLQNDNTAESNQLINEINQLMNQ